MADSMLQSDPSDDSKHAFHSHEFPNYYRSEEILFPPLWIFPESMEKLLEQYFTTGGVQW